MLSKFSFDQVDNRYENFKLKELADELDKLQRIVQRLKISVLILLDGWESSGKGFVLNELTRELDPRYVRVEVFEERSAVDQTYPSVWRFWQKLPMNEEMVVFDQSFYAQVMNVDERSKNKRLQRVDELLQLEKMLIADGTIVIKLFLHVTQKVQEKNIEKLEKDPYQRFRLSTSDYQQNKHYKDYLKWFDIILDETNIAESPWHVISGNDRKLAAKTVLGKVIESVTDGIERVTLARERSEDVSRDDSLVESQLDKFDVTVSLLNEEYEHEIEKLQREAAELVYEAYTKGIAIVVAFEGVDAAGKGGAIQQLTRHIDPRSYRIYGIKAPTALELSFHYLWRFWTKFPKDGDMVIFDRTWYGRVLVERIERLASSAAWNRAYDEINHTEKVLADHGTIVVKCFLYIDKDEQAKRFKARLDEPDKNYKITNEDWRNRDKWDDYRLAYEEMLNRTSTSYAPWKVIASNDKHYARVAVLKHFIHAVKHNLNQNK